MTHLSSLLELTYRLHSLETAPSPSEAKNLLEWFNSGGFETLGFKSLDELKSTCVDFLTKQVAVLTKPEQKLVEIKVQRLDRDEALHYPLLETATMDDLRKAVAEHETLPIGEIEIWHLGLFAEDKKQSIPNQGKLSNHITKLSTFPEGSTFVVVPTGGRDTWDKNFPDHKAEVMMGGGNLDTHLFEYRSLQITPTTTVGQVKRKIWLWTGIPVGQRTITVHKAHEPIITPGDGENYYNYWNGNYVIEGTGLF